MGLHHDHSHEHGHHHHGKGANKRALAIALAIIAVFLVVEVIGGLLTNSLALLSDAGHMLSDASALLLSLVALHFASKKPSPRKTYGYHRFEILAALLNGITLVLVSLYIFWEAYQRLSAPPEVASLQMMGIAFLGLLANIVAAFVLMRGDYQHNLNMRSAFLHVLGDMLGSVGAIAAGFVMWQFGWYIADPLISIVVGILVLLSAWRVTKESVNVLMEGSPSAVNVEQVSQALSGIPGVQNVHDLHVWTVTSGFDSLTCHLRVKDGIESYPILREALQLLEAKFHISHATIQIENASIHHPGLMCQAGEQHEHEHGHRQEL